VRIVNTILGVLMIAFAAVQLNDPDSAIWIVYYLIGAAWALLAAFKNAWIRSPLGKGLLWLCILVALGGVIYYFPQMDRFWERDVWWNEETAREGMGVMILLFVMLVALISSRSRAPKG
jgi:uncharacterized membrane protein HdeD (DUF308 family)